MKLKPSARPDRRYLLIEAKSKEEVEKAILDYIGVLGWAKAAPVFVDVGKEMILCVNRKEVDNVRAALELCEGNIKVKRVSGTLKGLGK